MKVAGFRGGGGIVFCVGSFLFLLLRKRELVGLLYFIILVWLTLYVLCLFFDVGLWSGIVVFPGHNHLIYGHTGMLITMKMSM